MAGNVAFMFLCTIMVLGMTPGLGMFYGGMVRRKNALNTMTFCCLLSFVLHIVFLFYFLLSTVAQQFFCPFYAHVEKFIF